MRKQTVLSGLGRVRSVVLILSLLVIAALGLLPALPGSAANAGTGETHILTPDATSGPKAQTKARVHGALRNLPLYFVENQGQLDARVASYV